jgi:hypothetical protein
MVSMATNVIKLVVSVAIVVHVEKIRGDAVPVRTDFMVKNVPASVATIVNLHTVTCTLTTMSITNIPYTMNVIIARNATGRSVPSIIATIQTVSINPVCKFTRCVQTTGLCSSEGCVAGQYGPACDVDCADCTVCDQDTGTCQGTTIATDTTSLITFFAIETIKTLTYTFTSRLLTT